MCTTMTCNLRNWQHTWYISYGWRCLKYEENVLNFLHIHFFVVLIRSAPTCLRCITDQTRSKYDQPTLYRRPPRCTSAQHTTCGERDYPRRFFNRLKNLSHSPRPLRAGQTNPSCILDQHTLSPIKARSLPIRPFFQSGRERGLIGSLVWTGLKTEYVALLNMLHGQNNEERFANYEIYTWTICF